MKSIKPIIIILLVSFSSISIAQTDTLSVKDSIPLLPNNYLFTQKILWSEHGLMRNFNVFTLSPESRELELQIRNYMITGHQYFGYATLAGMITQGYVGYKLYGGDYSVDDLHEGLGVFVNTCYFTTAGLAFFAPPPLHDRPSGISAVKIHKVLSIIHLSSMITTNVLAGMIESNYKLRPYHRAAAFTAFGSFFISMAIIKF